MSFTPASKGKSTISEEIKFPQITLNELKAISASEKIHMDDVIIDIIYGVRGVMKQPGQDGSTQKSLSDLLNGIFGNSASPKNPDPDPDVIEPYEVDFEVRTFRELQLIAIKDSVTVGELALEIIFGERCSLIP